MLRSGAAVHPRPWPLRCLVWIVLALTVGPKLAAVGFGEGLPAKPAKLKSLKPAKKGSSYGRGIVSRSEQEQRRQRRLGKDPSINRARKTLLGETAEQVFQIGDMELPLLVPAYVLDYQRFSMMVEAGAGTVSDIVWQL
ncbi:unnamed protein product [Durusdinium trenchii]|uniref:Uncharacterized protein n=1 Tax=Durusdinium trenchii TaxID=1381693 RepID=A0ABP0SDF9_9DINO